MTNPIDLIGVVVIGRNEGGRLKRCFKSILNYTDKIVYVDSGSSDGSLEYSVSIGIECVKLDMTIPFNAGRARNEGYHILLKKYDQIQYIQFIDGDCELQNSWLSAAGQFLDKNLKYAIIAGRVSERHPEQSIYNLMCDIEWNSPTGEAESCGGIFMIRKIAFEEIGGFNPTLIAGEEPELCYRLRQKNWSIYRHEYPMAIHEAAITKFSQWWKRCIRTGHAYAQGYSLHAHGGQGFYFSESLKTWFWAFLFPVTVLVLTIFIDVNFVLFFSFYIIQLVKITLRINQRIDNIFHSFVYSFLTIIGKWPQFIGQLYFIKNKLSQQACSIIEYK